VPRYSCGLRRTDVTLLVVDEKALRWIDEPMRHQTQNHARLGLSPVMGFAEFFDFDFGMEDAIALVIYPYSGFAQFRLNPLM
jgi:hypothetical protein